MKHLITGGAGFIGYHLARRLAERGEMVDLVDDLSRGRRDAELEALLAQPNVRFVGGDVTDPGLLSALDRDYAGVYHLAAIIGVANVLQRPDEVLAVNARAVLNVLDWFATLPGGKFFFASTSEAYAWTMTFHELPVPTPEAVPLAVDDVRNRRAAYALSKVFGEMAVVHTCERHSKPYAIARFHNVYGPRMGMAHVMPELGQRVWHGQNPLVVYSTTHSRAFCYIDDAIDAVLALMEPTVASTVYNVGNDGEEVTIEALAHLMLELEGRPGTPIEARNSTAPGILRRCPDVSGLRAATGFAPRVSLREGVRRTLAWYRDVWRAADTVGAR